MHGDEIPAKLHKGVVLQKGGQGREVAQEELFEVPVADVAGGDQQELVGLLSEEQVLDEVPVLG